MTHRFRAPRFGRRDSLLLLAGMALPGIARAQDGALPPQVTTPMIPPTGTPSVPPTAPVPAIAPPTVPPRAVPASPTIPAAPPRPAAAPAAIDKTKSYYVFFEQNIDIASMRALRRQLATLVEAGVTDITLVIDSAGGLLEPTLVTYSFIRALPAKISTHAHAFVQSAATLLYLAGEERSADRNARFLFHPSQSAVTGLVGEQQIRDRLAAMGVIKDVVGEIYRDRTHLPEAEIDRFAREEVIYTAQQAQLAGVVQTVADLRMPGDGKARIVFLD